MTDNIFENAKIIGLSEKAKLAFKLKDNKNMTNLEVTICKKILSLVPNIDKLEFRANVDDRSHSVEFYATFDGKRMQCYDMADSGIIDENKLTRVFKDIADCIRHSDTFRPGEINKIKFTAMR